MLWSPIVQLQVQLRPKMDQYFPCRCFRAIVSIKFNDSENHSRKKAVSIRALIKPDFFHNTLGSIH
jgi:hypothetical protein